MTHKDGSVVIEQIFDRPIHIVWEVISKPEQMTKWFLNNFQIISLSFLMKVVSTVGHISSITN